MRNGTRHEAAKALRNLRAGRVQRTLSAVRRPSAAPLAFEIYLEHYKGSFGDKWEWVPIWLTPPVVAAGIARRLLASASPGPRCR